VDLHHLRDMLEEMGCLTDREKAQERDPRRRDKSVGVRRWTRDHA
jgi:hypothetical protein